MIPSGTSLENRKMERRDASKMSVVFSRSPGLPAVQPSKSAIELLSSSASVAHHGICPRSVVLRAFVLLELVVDEWCMTWCECAKRKKRETKLKVKADKSFDKTNVDPYARAAGTVQKKSERREGGKGTDFDRNEKEDQFDKFFYSIHSASRLYP